MYERFSDSAWEAVSFAQELAERRSDKVCHTGHLLVGIFATTAHRDNQFLESLNLDVDVVESHLESETRPQQRRSFWRSRPRAGMSDTGKRTIELAMQSARDRKSSQITVDDLLCGMLETDSSEAVTLLRKLGIDTASLHRSCYVA